MCTSIPLRAAINNLKCGGEMREGGLLDTLREMAAFISMTDSALGQRLIEEINRLAET